MSARQKKPEPQQKQQAAPEKHPYAGRRCSLQAMPDPSSVRRRVRNTGKMRTGTIYVELTTPAVQKHRRSVGTGLRFVRGVGMVVTRRWVAEIEIYGRRYRYRNTDIRACQWWLNSIISRFADDEEIAPCAPVVEKREPAGLLPLYCSSSGRSSEPPALPDFDKSERQGKEADK